ncbi:MAG: response regulator, partial [Gammaproteobacteria bacterium]|nr:response regulator [Gammaproteobacteria bacterium]
NRVLVVDDDVTVLQTYRTILRPTLSRVTRLMGGGDSDVKSHQEFELTTVLQGLEGVEAVRRAREEGAPYALAFIDMRMPPGIDGLQTTRLIRELDREITIVIVTAYSDSTLDEMRAAGGSNILLLRKPFNRDEIRQFAYTFTQSWQRDHELMEKQQVLQQQHDYINSILNSMQEGVVVVDPQEVICDCNPALERLTGKPRERLIGERLQTLFVEEEGFCVNRTECLLRPESGEDIPVHLSGSLRQLQSGESGRREVVDDAVLVVHDLRELLRAESAHRANEAKDEFLALMSHELRSPLTTILGNSELLAESVLDEAQLRLLHSVEIAGRGLLALINDVLDFSKIESGKFSIDEYDYDLALLVEEIEHVIAISAQEKGLTFSVDNQTTLSHQLIGDPQRIRQILINLLSNALKFTTEGGVTLALWVEEDTAPDAENNWLVFSVSDSGVGISPEGVELLFAPFKQADSSISRRFGGTGLGLHISATLTEMMGGKIRVESVEGEGSTFRVSLPLRISQQALEPVEKRDQKEHNKPARATFFSGEVLVAEDTPEIQLLVRQMLERMGGTVALANDGNEAIAAVISRETPFNLILMDMQMPVMDGIAASRQLRKMGNQTPIVALTANVMQKHRDQFFAAGCDDFLMKPIDRQVLATVLQTYLQPSDSAPSPSSSPSAVQLSTVPPLIISSELQQIFVARINELMGELLPAFSKEEWSEVYSAAHVIKGSGTSFGHPELTQLGKAVCDAIDQGAFEELPGRVRKLMEAMGQVD